MTIECWSGYSFGNAARVYKDDRTPKPSDVYVWASVYELKGVILTSAARFMAGNRQDLLLNFIIAPVCEEVCKHIW